MQAKNLIFLALLTTLVGGCASGPKPDSDADRKRIEQELSGEMSLKADRAELAELRKDVPEERRKTNDELALYLQLMKQGTEKPAIVRDKFTSLVQKKRQSFRDKVTKLRENYHHSEQKRRDEYLQEQKSKREAFQRAKHPTEETRSFFGDQDRDRQTFFGGERDRRQSFEAEIRAQSSDFDSYMHEKTNEFNEQYRLYSKAFSEKPVEKKAVTGESDFHQLDKVPAKTLGTED